MSRKVEVPVWHKVLLSAAEAAELASTSEHTIRDLVAAGKLAVHPDYKVIKVARIELDRWVALTELRAAA